MPDIVVQMTQRNGWWVMFYVDPTTNRRVYRSTGKREQQGAERVAREWQKSLRRERHLPCKVPGIYPPTHSA
jgi:hypothetical protein